MFDTADTRVRPELAPGLAIELPWRDPVATFLSFAGGEGIAFLHSDGPVGERSRYSYLCVDPLEMLRGASLVDLQASLARHGSGWNAAPVPFAGGAVGFFGYDAAAALEGVARAENRFPGVPETQFGVYDIVFAWDRAAHRCWLMSALGDSGARLEAVLAQFQLAAASAPVPKLHWRESTTRALHMQNVSRALEYIRAGDIYQANITAAFKAKRPAVRAADIFAALQSANPAPFSAFIGCGNDCAVASVSPERFLRVDQAGRIEARPIKGTRPRGATPQADAAQAEALLASAKDHAENLMIVDLLRNDLSRVARIGSVAVPTLAALESFASVHHLVSAITASLRPGCSAIDLLRAALPGGSITGAPKIRAMQIIAELEGAARGPYCGSACWIGFDGAMDSNILIRTVTVTTDDIIAQAGGGIVADSDPAGEWDELMVKIAPLLRALGDVPPGLSP